MAAEKTMQEAREARRVSRERSGWRDSALSERHRQWGFHVPAVDIDFLLVEYTAGEPRALIEYKHEQAALVPATSANLKAISRLADWASLPAFVVRYADNLSWYRVRALNVLAREMLPEAEGMTEDEYVAFLYQLRSRESPTRREAG